MRVLLRNFVGVRELLRNMRGVRELFRHIWESAGVLPKFRGGGEKEIAEYRSAGGSEKVIVKYMAMLGGCECFSEVWVGVKELLRLKKYVGGERELL